MKKILLASHGKLAFGLKDTMEIFLGKRDDIVAVGAYLDETDRHIQEIQDFITAADEEGAIIFTDIYGGSVNQKVTELVVASNKNIMIVTSMNLPIVLSIALSNELLTPAMVEELAKDCIPAVVTLHKRDDEAGGLDAFFE